MTREEIDTLWQQAVRESVKDGETFTRYHFAELVAQAERQAIAKADHIEQPLEMPVAWFTGRFWTDAAHGRNLCEVVHNAIPIAGAPLYTHPQPKREWKGLTDEEMPTLVLRSDVLVGFDETKAFIRAIEAKLKEKNHV